MFDAQSLSAAALIQEHEVTASEKGILLCTDSPVEELRNVQRKIDILQEEIMRRMAW